MDIFKLFGSIVIDSSEADATIDSTTDKAKKLGQTFQNTGGTVQSNAQKWFGKDGKFGAASVWMGNMLTKLTDKGIQLTKTIFGDGLNYNASMERYTKSFATYMSNDMEAADAFMGKLREMAKITPLDLDNLAEGANRLMSVGVSAEDALSIMQKWGDVAQGDSDMFGRLILAYSQMIGGQRVQAEELNQMRDAGFPVWKIMPEYLGMEPGDFYDAVRKGEITPDAMNGLLDHVTAKETNMYYGAMERAMEGYKGQLEMLGDTYSQVKGAFTKPFFDEAASSVFPRLNGILDRFLSFLEANPEKFSKFAESVGNIVVNGTAALTDLLTLLIENENVLPGIAAGIAGIVTAISPAKGVLIAISLASLALIANWEKLKEKVIEIWNSITGVIDRTVTAVERFFGINRGSGTHETESGERYGGSGGSFLEEGEVPGPLPENLQSYSPSLWADVTRDSNLGSAMLSAGYSVSNSYPIAILNQILSKLNLLENLPDIAANTGAGTSVTLDSGAIVGQILPSIDAGLGAFANRKRR